MSSNKKSGFSLDPTLPKALYEQLVSQILARINSGEYEEGKPLPAIKAFESMVNASRITIVRALKELSALGIITARGTRGYFVNSRKDPTCVGFIVPLHTVFLSIYSKMHAALQLTVRRHYGKLVVTSSEEDPRIFEDRIKEMVFGKGIRKLAVVPPHSPAGGVHPQAIETLKTIGALPDVRMVVMDRDIEPDGYSVLHQNYVDGYRQALMLLAGRGYRKVLVFNAEIGVEEGCASLQQEPDSAVVSWHRAAKLSQQEIMEQVLIAAADAVIMPDLTAALLFEHFGTLPFAVIGYNGSDFVDTCPANMTCVDSNLKEMGRVAFQLLESGRKDVKMMIDPCIRLGETTPMRERADTHSPDAKVS